MGGQYNLYANSPARGKFKIVTLFLCALFLPFLYYQQIVPLSLLQLLQSRWQFEPHVQTIHDHDHGTSRFLVALKDQSATDLTLHARRGPRPGLQTRISCSPFTWHFQVGLSQCLIHSGHRIKFPLPSRALYAFAVYEKAVHLKFDEYVLKTWKSTIATIPSSISSCNRGKSNTKPISCGESFRNFS